MFNMRRRAPVSAADLQRRQVALGLVPAPMEAPTPAVEEARAPDADTDIEPAATLAPARELRIVAETPVPVSAPAEEEWCEWRGPVEHVQEGPGCAVGSVLGCGLGRDHHCFWIWYGRIGRFICRKCEPGRWMAIPKATVSVQGER